MPNHFRLSRFRIKSKDNNNVLVLFSGDLAYYEMLVDAFRQHRFSISFPDKYDGYEWAAFLYDVGEQDVLRVRMLLNLFRKCVHIQDALSQTFALDYHWDSEFGGRTEIGEMVYKAKPYRRSVTDKHKTAATELAAHLQEFMECHPSYRHSEYIIPVPSSKPGKGFHLPDYIVNILCTRLEVRNGSQYVRVKPPKKPMKDCQTVEAKLDNIRDAFQVVENAPFQSCVVTLVDDIYQSGSTINELASELKRVGARVQGITATKTMRDPI